jgi:hypothetical protein
MSRKDTGQKCIKDILALMMEYNCHPPPSEAVANFHVYYQTQSKIAKISEMKNESLQSELGLGPNRTAMIEPTTATVKEDNCRYE